jgi:5'-methylthioinosine phosphorylase
MLIGILIGSIQPTGLEISSGSNTPHGEPSSAMFSLETEENSYRIIARHGLPPRIPPHMVNHKANIWALEQEGVEAIISICSTGALKKNIPVPMMGVPEDYIDLSKIITFHDDVIHHATPQLNLLLREALSEALTDTGIEFMEGGVYIQTAGPRLETKAEVRMMSSWGDYVGMNLASEATLCSELEIPIAGLITIDNYANGVVDEELEFKDILADAKSNWIYVRKALGELSVPDLHVEKEVEE